MAESKRNGKQVSFDINYRNLMWKDDRNACIAAVQDILSYVDFLKISEEEEDMLGMSPEEAAKKYGISVLVEILGSAGAKYYRNDKVLRTPGRKANCVDTTGAGDSFWGGFLSYLLRAGIKTTANLTEELLLKAMHYGNVAGWLCVQKKGAMESLLTYEQVAAVLEAEA